MIPNNNQRLYLNRTADVYEGYFHDSVMDNMTDRTNREQNKKDVA